jgi:exodeoxyribonuclease V beta subunit
VSADLAATLPLNGLRLIEASAGTGKTYTIAGLYLRVVVELGLCVGDILVVTFTRAATEELKDRLRQRLALCADIAEAKLRGQVEPEPAQADGECAFAEALLARALDGGESLPNLARRLRLAAVSMDEAAIHTIHGFCQRVLREQAFVSGLALDGGELVGSDDDLIAQIAADFWRLHASDAARVAEFDLLVAHVGSVEALTRVLRQTGDPDLLLWPREEAPAADTLARLYDALNAERDLRERLFAAWRVHGERDLAAVLDHARAGHLNRQSHAPEKIPGWIAECVQAFAADHLPARATLERFGAQRLADRVKKNCPPLPALAFPQAIDAWAGADETLRSAQARHWPALLARARRHMAEQLETRKRHAARQSYDDLVRSVHAAITDVAHGAQLAAALHARYPFVLVDEFQDTDTRQFEIFRRMHAVRDDGALILVGDPKQAIYRFRGGDIEAYLRAAAQASQRYALGRNFRSSPGLLKAIEAVFSQGDDPAQAFVDPRILFHTVSAGGRAADDDVQVDGRALTPLTCWHLDGDDASSKGEARAQLAAGCAEAIVDLLRKAQAGTATIRERSVAAPVALAPGHIAVLVSTNDEAALMQDALAARGVASATIRQESVFGSEEARDLHAFLAALENRREARLRAALASRLFGYDAAHIARLADPAHASEWQAELQRLDALHRLWQQHGVLAMCERVFETHAAAILDGPGGERRMTNYLQLADLLQRESARLFGAPGLIDWLYRRILLADDRNEDEQLRLESDADRVQIATIHVSKGLEYDLVFLPFTALAPGQPTARPRVVEWHAHARRNAWVRTNGDDDVPPDALERSECEELAERVRVLYVALTRARYACWLSWDVVGGKGGRRPALAQLWHGGSVPATPAEARAALVRLADSAADVIRVEALPASAQGRIETAATTELPPARRFDVVIDTHWWITSFSQLRDGRRSALGDAAGADDEAARPDAEPEPSTAEDTIFDWPRGDRFGTAMHEILERIDFALWRGATDRMPAAERDAIRVRLHDHALAPVEREAELLHVVTRMIGATMNAHLPGGLRLADLAPSERRAEMPFHFAIGDADPARLIALLHQHGYQQRRTDFAALRGRLAGLVTGVIDLVYRHDARWWIVDYKTNRLGPRRADYAPAALAAAVREHDYELQYVIYTLALHRWLRLRLGADYDYERDIGGAVYLFLRGLDADGAHGVHVDRPPRALIEALDALLAPGGER